MLIVAYIWGYFLSCNCGVWTHLIYWDVQKFKCWFNNCSAVNVGLAFSSRNVQKFKCINRLPFASLKIISGCQIVASSDNTILLPLFGTLYFHFESIFLPTANLHAKYSGNSLEDVPSSICNLACLKSLSLNGNKIRQVCTIEFLCIFDYPVHFMCIILFMPPWKKKQLTRHPHFNSFFTRSFPKTYWKTARLFRTYHCMTIQSRWTTSSKLVTWCHHRFLQLDQRYSDFKLSFLVCCRWMDSSNLKHAEGRNSINRSIRMSWWAPRPWMKALIYASFAEFF